MSRIVRLADSNDTSADIEAISHWATLLAIMLGATGCRLSDALKLPASRGAASVARISGRTFRRRGWGLLKVVFALLQEAPHRFAGAACWHRYWGRIAVEDHFDLLLRVSDHGHDLPTK